MLGLRPVTGGELTLACGSRLARTREGYGNRSRLFTLANAVGRRNPRWTRGICRSTPPG